MTIESIHQSSLPMDREQRRLHAQCQAFEEVFVSVMLKESLKSASAAWQDNEAESPYLDMVYDQLANHLGQQRVLGIADALYQQLTPNPPSPSNTEVN